VAFAFALGYILQYSFWFGFESEKLESLYWYLEDTQGHSMRPTSMITPRHGVIVIDYNRLQFFE